MYSDINQKSPQVESRVWELRSIFQHIYNILNVKKRELFYEPEFGSDYEDFLFLPMVEETEFQILGSIVDSIERWEPRVTVVWSQSSVVGDSNKNTYVVQIVWHIKNDSSAKYKISFNLPIYSPGQELNAALMGA